MAELLRYCGFVMVFFTDTDYGRDCRRPTLKIVRKDALATTAPKLIYLAADGATSLDLTANNVTALHLARDSTRSSINGRSETGLKQVEITRLPGAGLHALDAATPANRPPFLLPNLTDATDDTAADVSLVDRRRMRRRPLQHGDGNMGHRQGDRSDARLPVDDDGNYTYVDRYRPGSQTLISKDPEGKPLKATLEIFPGLLLRRPRARGWHRRGRLDHDPARPRLAAARRPAGDRGNRQRSRRLVDRLGQDDWRHAASDIHRSWPVTWTATPTDETAFTAPADDRDRGRPAYRRQGRQADRVADQIRPRAHRPTARIISNTARSPRVSFTTLPRPTRAAARRRHEPAGHPRRHEGRARRTPSSSARRMNSRRWPARRRCRSSPTITRSATGSRSSRAATPTCRSTSAIDQGETPSYPWITAFAWDFQGDKQQTVLQFSDRRAEPQGV